MPQLTSVASKQKKYEREQGRMVGEHNFRKFAKFRKMSKTVDSARVIHSNACSFATKHSYSAHNCVAHTLPHTHTHTLLHTHTRIHNENPNTTPHTWLRAHTILRRSSHSVFRIIKVVRIPTVFVREQGWCLRASIWSAVSTSHPRGNHG